MKKLIITSSLIAGLAAGGAMAQDSKPPAKKPTAAKPATPKPATARPAAPRPAPRPVSPRPTTPPKIEYDKEALKDMKKVSYVLGTFLGEGNKRQFDSIGQDDAFKVDMDSALKGISDMFKGEKLEITDEERQNIFNAFRGYMQEQQQKKREEMMKKREEDRKKRMAQSEINKKKGEEFLAKNKSAEGVKATASGLQYKILKEADGETPTTNSRCMVHYKGTLLDGTQFDASPEGKPVEFSPARLTAGFKEALLMMPVGSKWKIWVPSKLAYGDNGTGRIPPGATLSFEMELVEVKAPAVSATPPVAIPPRSNRPRATAVTPPVSIEDARRRALEKKKAAEEAARKNAGGGGAKKPAPVPVKPKQK